MEKDESPEILLRQNMEIVLNTLNEIGEPVAISKLIQAVAKRQGLEQSVIGKEVKHMLKNGVKEGLILLAGLKYSVANKIPATTKLTSTSRPAASASTRTTPSTTKRSQSRTLRNKKPLEDLASKTSNRKRSASKNRARSRSRSSTKRSPAKTRSQSRKPSQKK